MTASRSEALKEWVVAALAEFSSRRADEPSTEVFLVEMLFRNVNGTDYLEIFVDTDAGITIDRCAEISRALGEAIEVSPALQDLLPNRFRLDVSSPGLSRPLRLLRQYRKSVGRRLRVKYKTAEGVYETLKGRLVAVSEAEPIRLALATADAAKGKSAPAPPTELLLSQVVEATIEVEF